MDNLRAVIKNLFCYISSQEIIRGNITYDNVREETFMKLGSGYITQYTNDEIRNMYFYLENEFRWQNYRLRGDLPQKDENRHLNVFDALMTFDYSVLMEEDGEPLCQYPHLLRWRDMVTVLEEDLFITSFLAMQDVLKGGERYYFFWKPVIGHNNLALNKLVARGVAENHFHLKGSAPMFHLSWLSLMNHVDNRDYVDIFRRYDKEKLQKNLAYDLNFGQDKLTVMWWQAALIRLALFAKLRGEIIIFEKTYVEAAILLSECGEKERLQVKESFSARGISNEDTVILEECQELLNLQTQNRIRKIYAETMLGKMLHDTTLLEEHIVLIQKNVNRMRGTMSTSKYDYAICESWLSQNLDSGVNEVLTGERFLMYSVFLHTYKRDRDWDTYINWFYLYLVLKANIRMEIVQANKMVGFDNFANYQNRKENFIEGSEYEKIYVRMAVRDTIINQHITSLEARVTPKTDAEAIQKSIQNYDDWICDGMSQEEAEEFKKRYFYVMHFIKGRESRKEYVDKCRHYEKRQQVKKQAQAIAELREKGLPGSERIHGIDACSAEIGCRPEVFAQAFRYLKNHSCAKIFRDGLVSNRFRNTRNIMATYHVGEDFLDIIDGLRAIDETISFLGFKCGDRLGHALALGVDIEEWYQSKSNRILTTKQDYLDNLVWLYAKIRKYNISECEEAKSYIERRFSEYFGEIYRNNFVSLRFREISAKAAKYFDERGMAHGYGNEDMNFGIHQYYDAWKLRGDDPELYQEGFYKLKGMVLEEMDYYAINREFPQNYHIRYNPEAAILYHMYHYDQEVITTGNQMIEVRVRPCIINAVKNVRQIMQREIAQLGIGIETNPSSNYMIGTFRRYDRHPIIRWYNTGLVYDSEQLAACPQIQVSINTDDQGVFSTYIENEYAYLALSLEKSKDEAGNNVYNRNAILQWLDNIRKMGKDQSFI